MPTAKPKKKTPPKKPVAPQLATVAEASNYQRTSRHSEVLALCDALASASPLISRTSIGRSGEGQDLVALVVSSKRAFTPELARKQKKTIVFIEANIHAGEVEGKEASLALVRDLTVGPLAKLGAKLFDRVCLVLVPNFNPDGNDRISPRNRALDIANLEGQVNPPDGVGMRYTGEGWNLNRDSMKQEAPETRCMAAAYQAFWPHLFIDCHTTDGSLHRHDLTYDCPRGNEALFHEVRAFNRSLCERVGAAVKQEHGFESTWYGNFVREDEPESGWHTYPALPRFGSHYRGLQGRLDVLLETYSYISYERRVAVQRAWLLELLKFAAAHGPAIQSLLALQENATMQRGQAPDPRKRVAVSHGVAKRGPDDALLFDYPAYALDGDTLAILSFDRPSLAARRYPGKSKQRYAVPHLRSFVPTQEVRLPYGYLAPASLAGRLEQHGICFTRLAAAQALETESYVVLAIDKTFSPDVAASVPPPGQAELPLSARPTPVRFETVLTVRPERRTLTHAAGTLFVPTAQRSQALIVYLLEPHSDDGFARWQFLDAELSIGALFPVHRVLQHTTPRVRPE